MEYTQKLIKNGDNSQRQQAYQLATVIQGNSSVKSEKELDKSGYTPLIFGGILVVASALVIGYLLGKKRKSRELEELVVAFTMVGLLKTNLDLIWVMIITNTLII